MKKILALVLACLMLVPVCAGLVSCGNSEKNNLKGAEIQMYIGSLPQDIDPSAPYPSTEKMRIIGLLFEGLMTITEDGKLEKALCKDYEYDFNKRTGNLELFITIENSRWSDGKLVTADDFRFAWKRILVPSSNNSNAALLYPILGAKAVKEGLTSEDDFGVYALANNLLQITFEKDFVNEDDYTDYEIEQKIEYFLRRLSSPALVPLRQDVVNDQNREWCTVDTGSYITNGPYKIKQWNEDGLVFERSINYRCVGDNDGANDKEVKPYRLITSYEVGDNSDEFYDNFKKNKCFFLNLDSASDDLIKKVYEDMESDAVLSTSMLYIDTTHELFANAKTRQALSMALDRTAIAQATYNVPATGFVPAGIEDADKDSDFREVGGALISSKADMEKAKELLKEAGVAKGETIVLEYVSANPADKAIAEACKKAWEELGFKVTLTSRPQKFLNAKIDGTNPMTHNSPEGAAVIVLANLQSVTPDAYSILTFFSGEFGGHTIDLTVDLEYNAGITGFIDEKYDAICADFVSSTTNSYRNIIMHAAEEYLVEQMPAIPVLFNVSKYVIHDDLSKYSVDGYGRVDMKDLKQKDFEKYVEKK